MKPITNEESMALSLYKYVDRCKKWIEEFNNGNHIDIDDPLQCPIHMWIVKNTKGCGKELVANIDFCPMCGNPCCPECKNHNVEQLSRVTGYMSAVSGWNAAKKQELKDRKHHNI